MWPVVGAASQSIAWKQMLKVRLPDGTLKEYPSSLSIADVAADIGPGLAKAALAGEVDGKVVGLDHQLPDSETTDLKILTKKDQDSLNVMRHSCAHVMARAIMRLRATGNGSYARPSQPPPALGVGNPMSNSNRGVSTKLGIPVAAGFSFATIEPYVG